MLLSGTRDLLVVPDPGKQGPLCGARNMPTVSQLHERISAAAT